MAWWLVSNEADNTMPATHNEVLADNALRDNCAKMQFHNSHETGSCSKTDNCDNVLLKVIDHLLEENKDLKRENAILKEKVNDCQCKADAEVATGKESGKQYLIESQRHSTRNSNSKCNAKGKNQLIKEASRYEDREKIEMFQASAILLDPMILLMKVRKKLIKYLGRQLESEEKGKDLSCGQRHRKQHLRMDQAKLKSAVQKMKGKC